MADYDVEYILPRERQLVGDLLKIDMPKTETMSVFINKLTDYLARHGIPNHMISDGSPESRSVEFRQFSEIRCQHIITIQHSQSSGKADTDLRQLNRAPGKWNTKGVDSFITVLELLNALWTA